LKVLYLALIEEVESFKKVLGALGGFGGVHSSKSYLGIIINGSENISFKIIPVNNYSINTDKKASSFLFFKISYSFSFNTG